MNIKNKIEALIKSITNCTDHDENYEKDCLALKLYVICNMQEIPADLRDEAIKIVEEYDKTVSGESNGEIDESRDN